MSLPGNLIYESKGCQSNLQQITHRRFHISPQKFTRISTGLLCLVRCNWIDPVQEVCLFGVRQIFGFIWASQVPRISICSLYLVEYNWEVTGSRKHGYGGCFLGRFLHRVHQQAQIHFGQIYFLIWTNTFCNLNKNILQFGHINFVRWTNLFCDSEKYSAATVLVVASSADFCTASKYILQFD